MKQQIDQWVNELARRDKCPWVGPRSQTAADEGMLIGRDDDMTKLYAALRRYSVIVLDGESGSGKSSLLQNGLFTSLRMNAEQALLCSSWAMTPQQRRNASQDIGTFVADRVLQTHRAFPDGSNMKVPEWFEDAHRSDVSAWSRMNDGTLPINTVLVLDQFEELLRNDPIDIGPKVTRWVLDVASTWPRARVIVSLRSDSAHLLERHLTRVRPLSLVKLTIRSISSPESIRSIIDTQRRGDGPSIEIAEAVCDKILALWNASKPDLLHVQGLLYALHAYAVVGAGSEAIPRITEKTLNDLLANATERTEANAFRVGLREAIRVKIDLADSAAREVGIDAFLCFGAREYLRRAVAHMYSGSFKVPINIVDLAERVLGRELESLRTETPVGRREIELALQSCEDVPFSEAAASLTHYIDPSRRNGRQLLTPAAGPMMALEASMSRGGSSCCVAKLLLREEIRRVRFAIRWLEASNLVRWDSTGILLLVHDGTGEALSAWASEERRGATVASHLLTGSRGENYHWSSGAGASSKAVTRGTLVNLNWRRCEVIGEFEEVVFLNCDLRGTRFLECVFRGVTFVNCLLDDANFEHCRIEGKWTDVGLKRSKDEPESRGAGGGQRGVVRLAPSFTVRADMSVHAAFRAYASDTNADSVFMSETSGIGAFLANGPPPATWTGDYQGQIQCDDGEPSFPCQWGRPSRGGLTILGGRVCFLTIYCCEIAGDSTLSLVQVAGSGVDIVGVDHGLIRIRDSSLRGLCVSVGEPISAESGESAELELRISDSLLANLYFGRGLAGRAVIAKSSALGVLNANAGQGKFTVALSDCRYASIVNCDLGPERCHEIVDLESDQRMLNIVLAHRTRFETNAACDDLASNLESMDFRHAPWQFELAQRSRRGRRKV